MSLARIIALLFAVAAIGFATQADAISFKDAQGSGYDHAIQVLADSGIIAGHPDGTVQPFNTLNRAEALKIILEAQEGTKKEVSIQKYFMPPRPLFVDIDQKAWYAPYVEIGFEHGVARGYPDGKFRPSQNLTVEEAIALLLRSYNEGESALTFHTSQQLMNYPNQWYTPYVSTALSKNLVGSREKISLGKPILRGQFFDMVYRLREVRSKNLIAYAETAADQTPVSGIVTSNDPDALAYASSKNFAITMPTLGITDLEIFHPDDPFTNEGITSILDKGVGHLFSYPGEGGKIMVYGHSSGYPWDISQYTKIFRKINELNVGDKAYVTYNGKVYVYEVSKEETIHVDDTRPFEPDADGEELILYTCWPPDTVDARYLVYLKPIKVVAVR